MPFSLTAFAKIRPYSYHLTADVNLDRIRRTGVLRTAKSILEDGGYFESIRTRRTEHRLVQNATDTISVRDQSPLHRGNLNLEDGFSFEDLVLMLNSRVFFWPGTVVGPTDYGVRHFHRYVAESPVILRVPTVELLEANPSLMPMFCRYNSGSPRCTSGRKSPRGKGTFVNNTSFDGSPSEVVELTFEGTVVLPASTGIGSKPTGPFSPLFR